MHMHHVYLSSVPAQWRPGVRLIYVLLSCAIGYVTLSAAEGPTVLLKARITQLEGQLQQVTSMAQVCAAQLAVATQGRVQQEQQKARASIEQEAGCTIDWIAIPPVCQSNVPATKP